LPAAAARLDLRRHDVELDTLRLPDAGERASVEHAARRLDTMRQHDTIPSHARSVMLRAVQHDRLLCRSRMSAHNGLDTVSAGWAARHRRRR